MTKNVNNHSEDNSVKYLITWNNIPMEVIHSYMCINTLPSLVHLSIESENTAPLPITETGYKSIFLYKDEIEYYGGVVPYILQLLDEVSKTDQWKKLHSKNMQQQLF